MRNKIYFKAVLVLVLFCISGAAYFYPVYQKGYPPGADHQNLMEARNFGASGSYKIEDSRGVLLSSENAKEHGEENGIFNPLTPIVYGYIFKYFGFNPELPFYLSIILFSLFNVVIFLLASRLFRTMIGFMSGIASALTPVMSVGAVHGGFYELAMLFFGLALFSYLGSKRGSFKASNTRVLISSIFFGLAALSRNAFAISFVPFIFYDFFLHRSYKRSIIFLIPFFIIFGTTLTPLSWLGVPNAYHADINSMPFDLVGHFFRDPYSYYFDKENYIKEMLDKGLNRTGVLFATDWGYDVSFRDIIKAHLDSLRLYLSHTTDLTSTGGPAVVGLMVLGVVSLYRFNRKLLGLFGLWWFLWLGYLVYDKTGNWDHLMEVVFIFAMLTGFGLFRLVEIIADGRSKKIFAAIILLLFVGHMAYANKWKFHDIYRSSKEEIVIDIKNKLSVQKDPGGVYAVGIHPSSVYSLNYHLDHDVVYFDQKTIKKLLADKKLKQAFEIYGITTVIGYDKELTEKIKSQVSILSIP